MAKITKSTLKSFINKNRVRLYINVTSTFDGMTDACERQHEGFVKAETDNREHCQKNTLGIEGIWLVGSSRDCFEAYEDGTYIGIEFYNCCGSGIVAVKKTA